jgi:preprotein translocase subunit SecA
MWKNLINFLGGNPLKRQLESLRAEVERINALEKEFEKLSDEALRAKTDEFRAYLRQATEGIEDEQEKRQAEARALEEILPQAFAAVREASKRTLGLRHYDVQLIGGIVLHRGNIAEMKTGEGKTLVATLPLYLNALTGRGVHLVTVNDYLARRDARWMGPIYHALGLSVGVLQMAAVTENARKAYLYDPSRTSPHEDQHQLRLVDRAEAYRADITYGTNSEFGFDYLRDNMVYRLEDKVQRGHFYAIIDEVDNVLIDEARTPLIISGPASGDLEWYKRMAQIVRQLRPEDYEINERDRTVTLTEAGIAHVEQLLGQPLMDPDRPEDINPEQARLMGYLEQALRAEFLFKKNKDYLVQGGKVIIIDEFTGRLMPGRRWSDGLHQAVEAKEGVKIEPENVTYATITLQNYFRMYQKLAGMTGTALTEAEEFHKIYGLEVVPIPTNLEYQAMGPNAPLIEIKARDEEGYEYSYFARRDDPQKAPLYYRRKDYPDVIYRTREAKLRGIVTEIVREHVRGRPLLIGTTSVEASEFLSSRLRAEFIRRLLQVLLIRHHWFRAHGLEEDGRLVEELLPLYEPLEQITSDLLRRFAHPLGLHINPEQPENLTTLLEILRLPQALSERLKKVIQGGIPHQVLNARKHAEESMIIANAGAFGAVTIATNMAGRGVDIKLGGELAEEVIAAVNRILRRNGIPDPFNMSLQERRQALLQLDPSRFGIYEAEARFFLEYFENMERVRALGGLHVIGSERHEARRIDNQLRGRAARQGDPGSSRFYLSLEDDLMRLFSGEQVSALMQRLRVDDALPLENRLVSRLIEESQHRVEGANFDMRKHLLEYDDVLNRQRMQIYSQRDRVLSKEDLREDILTLLREEIAQRVPASLEAEAGPWTLFAWLEQIQPTTTFGERFYPSYGMRLLAQEIRQLGPSVELFLRLTQRAAELEHAHILEAVEEMLETAAGNFSQTLNERQEALDTFFETLQDREQPLRLNEVQEELTRLLRMPLRLSNAQWKTLLSEPETLQEELTHLLENHLLSKQANILLASLEHRLGEGVDRRLFPLDSGWESFEERVLEYTRQVLQRRFTQWFGENGQIAQALQEAFAEGAPQEESQIVQLLYKLAQGTRLFIDPRTRRQGQITFTRFRYYFLMGEMLQEQNFSTTQLTEDILEHLQGAIAFFDQVFGRSVMNEVHRQLLLGAISDRWVEYLTQMEALRVSIGLEAYAQRDPLVQYKSKAGEMYQQLVRDIRALVITHLFTSRPRIAVVSVPAAQAAAPEASSRPKAGKAPRGG